MSQAASALDRHLPGEEGTWVFIFGGLLEFTLYFGAYLHSRTDDPRLFAESQKALDRNLGALNTLFLLLASLLVATAVQAVRRRERQLARKLIAGAFVCGVAFSAVKLVEYQHHFAHGISWSTNGFFQYYFLLTGLHWFHLAFAMALLGVLFVLSGKEDLTPRRMAYIEGGACFWHTVDVLWIVLFPLLYLIR